jgi:HEAT repeat protein
MLVGHLVVLLAALPAAADPVAPPKPPPAAPAASPDEQLLKGAGAGTTGPALLDFFKKRTAANVGKDKLADLVKQLGDKAPAARDAATADLLGYGEAAVPALRQAANNYDDPDYANRAKQCIQNIEGQQGANLVAAAAHALAASKPDGAAEALINFYPYADNDKVEEDVVAALVAVGSQDGSKPEGVLFDALKDKTPARRAAAAAVLCKLGGKDNFDAVRPLLKDDKPTVRLRAALSLTDAYNNEGVPVLIDLLAELPPAQRKQAEEYLTQLAGDWAIAAPGGNDVTSRRLRRDAWAAWWKGIDATVLLDEFKSRTMSDDERDKALALIQKLDDVSAAEREKASADLVAMGLRVTPLLRQAATNPNPRIGPFALKCLQLIEKDTPNPLPGAAPRMLALRSPDGAVATLLAYLPYAESAEAAQQVRDLIASLAVQDAKAGPVLLKALSDKISVRRSAAAAAIAHRGPGDDLEAVRKLLKDDDADVRLRTGLALVAARDKQAVPALIGLLSELPTDRVWEAEEMLVRIAGEKAPSVSVVGDAEARTKGRDAWKKWWDDNNASVDLAKIDFTIPRELGYMLIIENFTPGKQGGRVVELDAANKERWKLDNIQFPQDAQVLPGGRVLVVDQNGQRVSERDAKGQEIWSKPIQQAFRCQRMPNGNTFVACRNLLVEFDRGGKEVFNHPYNNDTILDCQKLRDGQIALVTYSGVYERLDAAGKQLKTSRVPFNFNFGVGGGEVLPNDHVILASPNQGKVYEYDADGKVVMEGNVPQAQNFFRMANGHTLVCSQNTGRVVELDQAGKAVNEFKDLPYRPWRVSRR